MSKGYVIGLEDLHVAKIKDDGTYDTPVKILDAVEASITPNTNTASLYADNKLKDVTQKLSDVEVSFTTADLSTEDYATLIGKTVDADGVIVDHEDDQMPYFAFGFKAKKSNGQHRLVWLYKGQFSIPEESYATESDSPEYQNITVTGRFFANDDGKWRARVDTDDPTVTAMVIDEWFDYVYGYNPVL